MAPGTLQVTVKMVCLISTFFTGCALLDARVAGLADGAFAEIDPKSDPRNVTAIIKRMNSGLMFMVPALFSGALGSCLGSGEIRRCR